MTGFALAVLLYLSASPIGPAPSPPPASPAIGEYILQLNGAITPSSAGALMAISDGLFEREGLSVKLRPGKDDADVTSAVAANARIIGIASAQGFLKARAEGLPIVAFATSYVLSSVEFFALADTRLIGPADLEGKRIGYKPGPEISTIMYAFIARNSISQSGLTIVKSDSAVADLLHANIDVLLGHRDVEGRMLENSNAPYRSLSPDAFGVHTVGPVYFANELAFASPGNLEKFFIAIANGWNAAYANYDRSLPIIAQAVGDEPPSVRLSRFMDAQRRFLRPSGARLGEIDRQRLRNLEEQLLQQRIIKEPVDLTRAVDTDILTEAYRIKSDIFSQIAP
jgi:ABC-type nitrate/sulfonate/bicarbonate transport system substrate-binding protein